MLRADGLHKCFLPTVPQFILFLGISGGGFSRRRLCAASLSSDGVFTALFILSDRLIPVTFMNNMINITDDQY